MAATAGKQGEVYVFNRDQIGCTLNGNSCSSSPELIGQAPMPPLDPTQTPPQAVSSVWGGIAYFNGVLYVARSGGCDHPPDKPDPCSTALGHHNLLEAYAVGGDGSLTSVGTSPDSFPDLINAIPSISANSLSNTDMSGIVWLVAGNTLSAYAASNVTRYIYQVTVDTNGVSDPHFPVVTVADGRVFIPTFHGVMVLGLI
jgi:hypothetical protein